MTSDLHLRERVILDGRHGCVERIVSIPSRGMNEGRITECLVRMDDTAELVPCDPADLVEENDDDRK